MSTKEEVDQQKQRLIIHRQNLAHYLKQMAQSGTTYTRPDVIHGIQEARNGIKNIKATLRGWNIIVEDYPDDEDNVSSKISHKTSSATQNINIEPESILKMVFLQYL